MDYTRSKDTDKECIPIQPKTVEETDLDFGFLSDLALKTVYADASCTTARAAEKMCLPIPITESLLQHLYNEKLVEIRGQISFMNHRYAMLDRGWQRVNRLLDLSGYIGPTPVSLQAYTEVVSQQSQAREIITPGMVKKALSELVLPEQTVETAGLVASSRQSLFMFGESGNGKTSIAVSLHSAQPGEVWIPYAIEVDGQIIKVFDRHCHLQVETNGDDANDKRWIKIKRPLIIVGGEMTIETMDLVYSRTTRYYEAPFQVKANGGTLVIDDFGRQRVNPVDLLNRWIIPLERGTDYLTLHTGKKIEVPFEQLLIFATNLDLQGLVDEAFLRRMGYRLYVAPPTRELYGDIFKKVLETNGITFNEKLLEFLFQLYANEKRPLRCCEPRDLIQRFLNVCRYYNEPPVLTRDMLELAWLNYFGERPPNV
jgi:predicted ATPase with chaperone activity